MQLTDDLSAHIDIDEYKSDGLQNACTFVKLHHVTVEFCSDKKRENACASFSFEKSNVICVIAIFSKAALQISNRSCEYKKCFSFNDTDGGKSCACENRKK